MGILRAKARKGFCYHSVPLRAARSGADLIVPSSYQMYGASFFELAKRQHVFLIVHFAHFRFDLISSANTSSRLGA